MNRRNFIKKTTAAAVLVTSPVNIFKGDEPPAPSVKNVHVIFKTHLDIGFTDLAENVIHAYFESFIPAALSLSEKFRNEGQKDRFIWTTGSWLIYHYLQQATPENRRRMEAAIQSGDIVWHGLPFTTHTELIDDSLFMLGTSLSAKLDKTFGRKTIAAKMTDVPGHTRGIVPLMQKAGLVFLHIGVNPASAVPDVPPIFIWRCNDKSELIVMYQCDYGNIMTLPDDQTAVAICFTGDNRGPLSPEQIAKVYQDLRTRFLGAYVFASTLDAVAAQLLQTKDNLPVVTQEIGDTWIHGPGSDPKLMAQFRELSRLRKKWILDGKLKDCSKTDIDFGSRLLLVAEHTWGMDIKTHLHDHVNFSRDEFAAARKEPNFRQVEASWAEKRAYITMAVQTLPPELAAEATQRVEDLLPKREQEQGYEVLSDVTTPIETKHFTIAFDPVTGAIMSLIDRKTDRHWATSKKPLALFGYQTFSQADYDRFFDQYVTHRFDWAINDFGKTGMTTANPKSRSYQPRLKNIKMHKVKDGHKIILTLDVPETEKTGCPGQIVETVLMPANTPEIHIDLAWFDKPAYRLPEAIWLSFIPEIKDKNGYFFDKMNHSVSPLDVVNNGGRNLHGIIRGINYADDSGGFHLNSYDAFLVAPGKKALLNFDNRLPNMEDGVHFCLFNNVWGTNFTMWSEEDMRFRSELTFQ